jgi:imidazolonepropionase-like amidohydrolase
MKLLKLSVFLLVASWSFFARAQTQTLVIRAGTMLDGAGHTLHNVMIVVEGGKIVRVEQNAKDQKLPGASAYDLTHMTVMPGWIDLHDHITWAFWSERTYRRQE